MNEPDSTCIWQDFYSTNTYIIQWYDNEGTRHLDYIHAKNVDYAVQQAMQDLGFDLDAIADVSRVIKKYERRVY